MDGQVDVVEEEEEYSLSVSGALDWLAVLLDFFFDLDFLLLAVLLLDDFFGTSVAATMPTAKLPSAASTNHRIILKSFSRFCFT